MRDLQKLAAVAAVLFATASADATGFKFIDTNFPNASPVDWDVQSDTHVRVNLRYDHERDSPNRAAGHWHFRVIGDPDTVLTLTLSRFENVWNGRPGLPINDDTITFLSEDGESWTPHDTEFLETEGSLQFDITIPDSGSLLVARLPPYRISNLEEIIADIQSSDVVSITQIGETVQKRPLEIVQVGHDDAPYRVFLRARAHPWEPGGNWVVDGLIRHLVATADDPEVDYLKHYCVYVMPMANKDGVANGATRFNVNGKDLNRDWDAPAYAKLCPENAALEKWLVEMIAAGKRPNLALEMHNDSRGLLHISRPPDANINLAEYLARMERLEQLLRQHSWFREGSTKPSFRNSGTLGEGWLVRYDIPAVVHELNANWIEGLNDYPSAENWRLYGRQLCDVFDAYFVESD